MSVLYTRVTNCVQHRLTYLSEGYLDDIAAWGLVGAGIYFQLFVIVCFPSLPP